MSIHIFADVWTEGRDVNYYSDYMNKYTYSPKMTDEITGERHFAQEPLLKKEKHAAEKEDSENRAFISAKLMWRWKMRKYTISYGGNPTKQEDSDMPAGFLDGGVVFRGKSHVSAQETAARGVSMVKMTNL